MTPRLCPRCKRLAIKSERAVVCRRCRPLAFKDRHEEIYRAMKKRREADA
jgi:hypothetical protein